VQRHRDHGRDGRHESESHSATQSGSETFVSGARSGIGWRLAGVEQVGIGIPVVHTYVLDAAAQVYRPTEVFTGLVKAIAPFSVEIDLREI
jgi:hypothetical protein